MSACRAVGVSVCRCVGLSMCRGVCVTLLGCRCVGVSVLGGVRVLVPRGLGESLRQCVGVLVSWCLGLSVCWSVSVCRFVGVPVCVSVSVCQRFGVRGVAYAGARTGLLCCASSMACPMCSVCEKASGLTCERWAALGIEPSSHICAVSNHIVQKSCPPPPPANQPTN